MQNHVIAHGDFVIDGHPGVEEALGSNANPVTDRRAGADDGALADLDSFADGAVRTYGDTGRNAAVEATTAVG